MPQLAPLLPAAALFRRTRLPPRTRGVGLMPPSGAATPGAATPVSTGGSERSASHRSPQSGGTRGSRKAKQPASSKRWRKSVQFASPQQNATYEITPYEEFYGMHPNHFNFDALGNMVPLSPMGFSPNMSFSSSPQSCKAADRNLDISFPGSGFGSSSPEACEASPGAPTPRRLGAPLPQQQQQQQQQHPCGLHRCSLQLASPLRWPRRTAARPGAVRKRRRR